MPLDPERLLTVQVADSNFSVASSVTGGMSFDQDQRRQEMRASLLRVLGEKHRLNSGLSLEQVLGGMTGTVSSGDTLLPSDLDERSGRGRTASTTVWPSAT